MVMKDKLGAGQPTASQKSNNTHALRAAARVGADQAASAMSRDTHQVNEQGAVPPLSNIQSQGDGQSLSTVHNHFEQPQNNQQPAFPDERSAETAKKPFLDSDIHHQDLEHLDPMHSTRSLIRRNEYDGAKKDIEQAHN